MIKETVKEHLLIMFSLDFGFPLNGYITIMNPCHSICRVKAIKVDDAMVHFSNYTDISLQFPSCTSTIYFNSPSILHQPLTCHYSHDRNVCESYLFTTLVSAIVNRHENVKTNLVDHCLFNFKMKALLQ